MHFTQFYLVLPSFIWFFYLFVLPFYKLFRIVSLTGINTDYVGKDWLAETLLLPTSFFFRVFTVSLHIRSPSFLALQIRFFLRVPSIKFNASACIAFGNEPFFIFIGFYAKFIAFFFFLKNIGYRSSFFNF